MSRRRRLKRESSRFSGSASKVRASTIGEQLASNHALTDPDEDHFVAGLLANVTAFPAYYAHMNPLNSAGPESTNTTACSPACIVMFAPAP